MPSVNPEILKWARETAGLTPEDAVHRIGLREARGIHAVDRLAALENGKSSVTRPLLLRMAKAYRRPLVTFYLKAPPARGDRGEDFRNLPDRHTGSEALVDALVRDIRARQSMVRAIRVDDEEAEPLAFVGSTTMEEGVGRVIASIRQTIGFDLAEFRAQASPEGAFALLRRRVESAGVFVLLAGNLGSHHTALEVEAFRGFALADEIAPFIVINDRDARAAWSFTLLHELAHLWLGATGVSGGFADAQIERFCNDVASSILLPSNELPLIDTNPAVAAERITEFAVERHLSRSMVAYRLFRANMLSQARWRELSTRFRTQWQQRREAMRDSARDREGGPNYYVVRRHRLGTALLRFVARSLSGGALSPTKAGKVLGVKPRSVEPLLSGAALIASQAG